MRRATVLLCASGCFFLNASAITSRAAQPSSLCGQAARTDGALEDMEDGAFEEDDEDLDEEEEEEEEEDSDDVSRFATAGIDAIARKQVRASCHDGSARSACVSLV